MTRKDPRRSYHAFICHDEADSKSAAHLREFLLKNFTNLSCENDRFYTPREKNTKHWIIQQIRTADFFILIMSKNSATRTGSLKNHLGWKHIEAKNFSKHIQMVYLFLDRPDIFSRVFLSLITGDKDRNFQILPDEKTKKINYSSLSEVLLKSGCVQKNIADDIHKGHGQNTIINQNFNVFISYKSEDSRYAKILYNILRSRGLDVFYSKESLPQLGSDEYREQIDLAIDQSQHMVIVASKPKHLLSQWVKYEWGLVLGEKLAGRKKGNLITILAGGLSVENLPISLRNREAIPLAKGEIERLFEYVK